MESTLEIIPDFITPEYENELLGKIVKGTRKRGKHRNSIQRFGSNAPYKGNIVSKTIPDYLSKLKQFIDFDSVTVNEYHPGQSISAHIDSPESGDTIRVISLLSDAVMVFELGSEKHSVVLPRRSLVSISDNLRWKWKHSILPVKEFRYSIVLRKSS